MFRYLCAALWLTLSGCILYVEDPPSHREDHGVIEIWLEDASLQCDYDSYWDTSSWYIQIYADTYWGPSDVRGVEFYIEYYDYFVMTHAEDAKWIRAFESYFHQCHDHFDFEFVATDFDGNQTSYIVVW